MYIDENFKSDFERGIYVKKLMNTDSFSREDMEIDCIDECGILSIKYDEGNITYITDECLAIVSDEPSNYGSFLFRIIPKIISILQAPSLRSLPILTYEINQKTTEFLRIFGLDTNGIIRHNPRCVYKLRRAHYPSLRCESGFLDHETILAISAVRYQFETKHPPTKIYVSRSRHNMKSQSPLRKMMNEEEVAERLRQSGFEIVYPEALSPSDLIRTFAAAKMVVGPSGSGMFNSIFCRPGTKILDIESEPHWLWTHTGLFASCQLDYAVFAGRVDAGDPRPVHKRWSVDVAQLLRAIAVHERMS